MKSIYDNIVILGTGKLAFYCGTLIQKKCGQAVEIIAYRPEETSGLCRLCAREEIKYEQYDDKAQLTDRLYEIEGKTLIVSACNTYLFPKEIAENERFAIINFHPALLPNHPGRNVEAWAIYEGDDVAGVTWHKVTAVVDAGEVLIQKEVRLDEKITSLKLMLVQQKLGMECFEQIADDVLQGREQVLRQRQADARMHYSWEIPNDGILDEDWDIHKISAFLRAMDYGILHTLGIPKIRRDGELYVWESYLIGGEESETAGQESEDYRIVKGNGVIILKGLKKWRRMEDKI